MKLTKDNLTLLSSLSFIHQAKGDQELALQLAKRHNKWLMMKVYGYSQPVRSVPLEAKQ